ncbi:MAG: hypothetical protein V4584_10900 [Verrucomicrobiota bacterium]
MTDDQTRRVATFGRIDGFAKLYPADFAVGSKSAGFLAIIRQAAAAATGGGTTQSTSDGKSRAGSHTKAELFDELYDDLVAISRTAKSMAEEVPGLAEKFRMPRPATHASVLTAARAFVTDAEPLAATFVEYELPADFLTDLADDIAAFEVAEDVQGDGLTQRVGATTGIAEAISTGVAALRRLDPILRNKYRSNVSTLAEWITASHIERSPRKEKVAAAV